MTTYRKLTISSVDTKSNLIINIKVAVVSKLFIFDFQNLNSN